MQQPRKYGSSQEERARKAGAMYVAGYTHAEIRSVTSAPGLVGKDLRWCRENGVLSGYKRRGRRSPGQAPPLPAAEFWAGLTATSSREDTIWKPSFSDLAGPEPDWNPPGPGSAEPVFQPPPDDPGRLPGALLEEPLPAEDPGTTAAPLTGDKEASPGPGLSAKQILADTLRLLESQHELLQSAEEESAELAARLRASGEVQSGLMAEVCRLEAALEENRSWAAQATARQQRAAGAARRDRDMAREEAGRRQGLLESERQRRCGQQAAYKRETGTLRARLREAGAALDAYRVTAVAQGQAVALLSTQLDEARGLLAEAVSREADHAAAADALRAGLTEVRDELVSTQCSLNEALRPPDSCDGLPARPAITALRDTPPALRKRRWLRR